MPCIKKKLPEETKKIYLTRLKAEGFRYILVGFTTTIIAWGTVLTLVEIFHIHYIISANVATFIAFIYTYFLNKYFVFKKREKTHLKHGTKFFLSQAFIWGFANITLYIGVDVLGFHYLEITIASTFILPVINFLLMKFMVFN